MVHPQARNTWERQRPTGAVNNQVHGLLEPHTSRATDEVEDAKGIAEDETRAPPTDVVLCQQYIYIFRRCHPERK